MSGVFPQEFIFIIFLKFKLYRISQKKLIINEMLIRVVSFETLLVLKILQKPLFTITIIIK